MSTAWLRDIRSQVGIFLFLIICTLYSFTLPDINTGFADSDEFLIVAQTGGVAHPSGYPLYTLLSSLMSSLPLPLSQAGRVNMLNTLLHALTVVTIFYITYLLLKELAVKTTERLLLSLFSALLLAFTFSFWFHSLFAEVFALNNFLITAVILLLLTAKQLKKNPFSQATPVTRNLFLFTAFTFGLGLSNQQTFILLVPAFLITLWYVDAGFYKNGKLILLCAGISLLGFLIPYTYLPIAAQNQAIINFEDPQTLEGIMRSITRRAYSEAYGSGAYISFDNINPGQRFLGVFLYGFFLFENILPILYFFAAVGIGFLVKIKKYLLLGVFLAFIFGGGLFFALYSPPLISIYSTYVLGIYQRFFLASVLIIPPLIAIGVYTFYRYLEVRVGKYAIILALFLPFFLLYQGLTTYREIRSTNFEVAPAFGNALLTSLEKDSILICYTEHSCFTALYMQVEHGIRQDVTIIPADLTQMSIEQIMKRYPGLVQTTLSKNSARDAARIIKEIIDQNIDRRPVYIAGISEDPAIQRLYGVTKNPYYLLPSGCALRVSKSFAVLSTDDCQEVEEIVLDSYFSPRAPISNMFPTYLSYQRNINTTLFIQNKCYALAQEEYKKAQVLNPLLEAIPRKELEEKRVDECPVTKTSSEEM